MFLCVNAESCPAFSARHGQSVESALQLYEFQLSPVSMCPKLCFLLLACTVWVCEVPPAPDAPMFISPRLWQSSKLRHIPDHTGRWEYLTTELYVECRKWSRRAKQSEGLNVNSKNIHDQSSFSTQRAGPHVLPSMNLDFSGVCLSCALFMTISFAPTQPATVVQWPQKPRSVVL